MLLQSHQINFWNLVVEQYQQNTMVNHFFNLLFVIIGLKKTPIYICSMFNDVKEALQIFLIIFPNEIIYIIKIFFHF